MKQLLLLCLLLSAPLFGQPYSLFETPNYHDHLIELAWGQQVWLKEQPQGKMQLFHLNGQPVFKQAFDQIWPSNFKGYLELQDGDKFYIGSLEGELWPLARTIEELGAEIKAVDFSAKSLGPVDYREISFLLGLPSALLQQTQLVFLKIDLDNSRLHREIKYLKNLKVLNLEGGSLRHLPKEIQALSQLEELDLGANDFYRVPKELALLPQLHTLYLDFLPIDSLGETVSALSQLKRLSWKDRISNDLAPLLDLKALNALDLELQGFEEHNIYALYEDSLGLTILEKFDQLEYLNLAGNFDNLKSVDFLAPLKNLRYLNLARAAIEQLPKSKKLWPKIEQLLLEEVSLKELPLAAKKWKKLYRFNNQSYTEENKSFFLISRLPKKIKFLILNGLSIKHEELLLLQKFKQLQVLSLSRVAIQQLPESFDQLKKLQELDLSHCQLTELPNNIGQLQQLKAINLTRNKLQSLPPSFYTLSQLQALFLNENQFKKLAPQLGHLKQLSQLELSNNQLKELPKQLEECKKLKILQVSDNQLKTIPLNFAHFKDLEQLLLYKNQLEEIPNSLFEAKKLRLVDLSSNPKIQFLSPKIKQLQQLKAVYLHDCGLQKLPDGICDLKKLHTLDLKANKLLELPSCMGQLQSLTQLMLSHNRLKYLPNSIGQLQKLNSLYLEDNQLQTLTPSIAQLKNLNSLDLDNNPNIKEIPLSFKKLTKLYYIGLYNCGLSEEEQDYWENLLENRDY
ncbi:hypothetical protein PPO43_14540 [Saprospira sp. CCB-QB6]|uniref:leucine-rich repeat domain-containing protein n=1 Tax=Saprospira sp. CCB-QB6 TaxID=3023936 RepID=UPI00234A82E2|nr:hypothetical protein [Saprospira sp. CCB-QB6]WCL81190.1 hypothetical protein PPO43_14540 [Saprospira sp. CCB-QB6]